VLHLLRRYLAERGLRQLPWTFIAAAIVVGGGLLLVRSSALQGVAAHRLPSFDQAWTNWTRGFDGAFRLLPAKRPWQPAASWFVSVAPLLALLLWRRLSGEIRFAMAAGLAIALLFLMPFAFIIKAEQLHLVVTGAALLLTATLTGLVAAFPMRRPVQAAILAVSVAGVLAMAAVARNITRDFEPYGPIVLATDRLVDGWAAVPVELVQYLIAKRTPDLASRPDPDPSRALPIVTFGLRGVERSPDGIALRWMASPTAQVFARRGTRLVSFSARHERGAFGEPAHVRIDADGQTVADTVFDDGKWHRFDIALRQHASVGLSGMHRIRIQLDHAWVPAKIIPGSGDGRTLGLQIGVIESR
jgi:hypothetical protein